MVRIAIVLVALPVASVVLAGESGKATLTGRVVVVATQIDWDPWVEPERLATLAPLAERIRLRLGEPVTASLVRR